MRESVLTTCSGRPGLRLILAHSAIPDLAHLAPRLDTMPNLFFDTSWWTPANVLALLHLVPPGRILAASDLPYSTPLSAATFAIRCAWQAGLDAEQTARVVGGQMARLLDGDEPRPRTGTLAQPVALSPPLEVAATNLLASVEPMQRGEQPEVPLQVARHACSVPAGHPDEAVLQSIERLLDLYEEHRDALPRRNQFTPGRDLLLTAAFVARTPTAPLP